MSQFERLQKAAALKYSDEGTDAAPVVVASGSGHIAQKIIGIAEKSGVPVFRDNSLATLLSQLQSGTEIPPELYRAVVEIYVYFLGFRVDETGKAVRETPPRAEGKTEDITEEQSPEQGEPEILP